MRQFRLAPAVLIAACMFATPAVSSAGIFLSINIAPPVLPVYVQPPCPTDGFLWTPGYWAYGDEGYFWVPGVWLAPPRPGLLWTPGYWGYEGAVYRFHTGYWGPHVGFYGGVNYGFGYTGAGFFGGEWRGEHFAYNTAVNRVNTTIIHNTYNRTVVNNVTVNRVSFNGPGGVNTRPTPQEAMAEREQHVSRTAVQTNHEIHASTNRAQFASVNHGQPTRPALERPGGGAGAQPERFASRPQNAAVNNQPNRVALPQNRPADQVNRPMNVNPNRERPAEQRAAQPQPQRAERPQPQPQRAERPKPQPQQHAERPQSRPQEREAPRERSAEHKEPKDR